MIYARAFYTYIPNNTKNNNIKLFLSSVQIYRDFFYESLFYTILIVININIIFKIYVKFINIIMHLWSRTFIETISLYEFQWMKT